MNKIEQAYNNLTQIDKSTLKGQQESDAILNSLTTEEKKEVMDLIQEHANQENLKMQPIYNEKEYKELDPDGLVKDFYEKEIKGKELDDPDWLKGKIKIDDGYWGKNRGLKIMSESIHQKILDHAKEISLCILYFSGDKELVQKVIKKDFDLINNSVIDHKFKSWGGGGCICESAEILARLAMRCGLPKLSKEIVSSVMCFGSPQYSEYRPALGVKEERPEEFRFLYKNREEWIKENIKRLAYKLKREKTMAEAIAEVKNKRSDSEIEKNIIKKIVIDFKYYSTYQDRRMLRIINRIRRDLGLGKKELQIEIGDNALYIVNFKGNFEGLIKYLKNIFIERGEEVVIKSDEIGFETTIG